MDDFIIEKDCLLRYSGQESCITIPSGVKKIKDKAIDLTRLESLTIPKSVKKIGYLGSFEEQGILVTYSQELPNKPTIFYGGSLNDYLRIQNESAYIFNYSCRVMVRQGHEYVCLQDLEEIVIPDDIRYLEDALCYCKVKKVVLGKHVKQLHGTFYMCQNLEEVIFNDRLEAIEEDAFSDCVLLGPTVTLPTSVKKLGPDCFRNCPNISEVYVRKDAEIDPQAFSEDEQDIEVRRFFVCPYRLVRNHYVATIGRAKYIIDTGSLVSYSDSGRISVGDARFLTKILNISQLGQINDLIGESVNGLIGLDILGRTSLTIYKDGKMAFFKGNASGLELPFVYPQDSPVGLNCTLGNDKEAVAIIDTGAMLYYGKYPECFSRDDLIDEKNDFSLKLGEMRAKFYQQQVTIAGKTLTLPVGDHAGASSLALCFPHAAIVMNVTELFNEVVVFDFDRRCVIID